MFPAFRSRVYFKNKTRPCNSLYEAALRDAACFDREAVRDGAQTLSWQ